MLDEAALFEFLRFSPASHHSAIAPYSAAASLRQAAHYHISVFKLRYSLDWPQKELSSRIVFIAVRYRSLFYRAISLRHWRSCSRHFEETYCLHRQVFRGPGNLHL